MDLYSHNNGPAQSLPWRIRLADGSTRTDSATFTPEEIISAGYFGPLPEKPGYDPATHHAPEWSGGQWVVNPLTAEELAARARKIWKTVADFWAEFSTNEQYAIQVSTDPTIIVARGQLAMWRGEVWSDDERVTSALDVLVTTQILTTERKTQILSNGI